ncbi:TetR/AcrR family transcriptional regulator [Bradyrhizobium cajani]|uniref:TetR family transcriptional regulator n=1 Tax=Bradyrhizobium cajani TaxID=1928661 RepID=A0A844TCL2_9BRAD|nr:TetR-like C-terminal domain-containing protein [Bradyrhizobium cajani]MCP3372541.1 WHG domain-containing protein [Bradyrhizobium cajani]MVT76817.1 TetR family transcriptional regulator [Bradyrhizobium cajani]
MGKSETKTEAVRLARTPKKTSTAASEQTRSARRPATAKAEAPYHHGALREALLEAAERVLERDGLAGLTLRAVAREAGVSHAAPTHHFGDLTGLLSELAAVGFRQFNAAMASASDAATTPLACAMARPKAYVAYAQAHPGMYGIMFRTERLDYSRPSLHEAAEASFAGLANAIGAMRQEQISSDALTLDQAAAIARAWSMVHGFTTLLLDGRLEDILERLPEGTTAERLFEAMLTAPITGKLPGH